MPTTSRVITTPDQMIVWMRPLAACAVAYASRRLMKVVRVLSSTKAAGGPGTTLTGCCAMVSVGSTSEPGSFSSVVNCYSLVLCAIVN